MKNSISKMIAVFCTAAVMVACTKTQLQEDAQKDLLEADPQVEKGGRDTISTAQSQMIYLNLAGGGNSNTFIIQGTTTWSFNGECAGTPATRLVNTSATFTSRTCSGGGSNSGQPCNDANAPATPTPTDAEILAALTSGGGANWSNAEKATFFCGGTITRTGTLQLTRTGLSGSGNWKFNYDVSASLAIAAESCWTSVTSTNGTNVNYNGFAAGESVQTRSSGTWKTKYSFSMTTTTVSGGVSTTVSRCQNVIAYLERQDATSGAWAAVESQPVNTDVISTTDGVDENGNPIPYDVFYYGNAGQAGSSTALPKVHAPLRLAAALVSSIVLSDDFSGNNNDLAERALLTGDGFNISSEPGTYRVRVTGIIKGNAGTVDAGFNVSTSFNVIGDPSCGGGKRGKK